MKAFFCGWLMLVPLAAAASAMADECDSVAATIASKASVTTSERSTRLNATYMIHPTYGGFSIWCPWSPSEPGQSPRPDPVGRPVAVTVNFDSAYPPSEFYDFAASVASIVSGADTVVIRDGAQSCQGTALHAKNHVAKLNHGGLSFDCQATADGAGWTGITIYFSERN